MSIGTIKAHRKLGLACLLSTALLLLAPASAFAGGYNDSGYNYTFGADAGVTGGNSGLYVRDPVSGDHLRSYQGPHGGYTTSTNKCKDCHAVHLALGAYMLTRSDTRHNACDFCHAGGGGSAINIQMDNDYDASGLLPEHTSGSGTGHTIGYQGLSPVDIKPAFFDPLGLACFDCHTPHAASNRVLTTFADPGRRLATRRVDAIYAGSALVTVSPDPSGIDIGAWAGGVGNFWGTGVGAGNIITATDGVVDPQPVFPTGRFLLLKNPQSTAAEFADDTTISIEPGTPTSLGHNKIAIDWDNPIGPAGATNSGAQNDPDGGSYFGSTGLLSVGEFCTDCHDGAAGSSTQRAVVWYRDASNPTTGTYVALYSHDSQPRDHLRQMVLEPAGGSPDADGTDDNFGPSCRQCHIGGSSCDQCHGLTGSGTTGSAYDAFQPVTVGDTPAPAVGSTAYWAQAYVSKSAIPLISGQCIDGGFSWPHRTLGVNLLGDELYGVDFDGTPVAAGDLRMDPDLLHLGYLDDQPYASEPETDTWKPFEDAEQAIENAAADNLDSACITCHGDATYWNGDDPAFRTSVPSPGWELVLKGLP